MSDGSIQHFSHEHALYKSRTWRARLCCLCYHQIPSGQDYYNCFDCWYYCIHIGCAEWPEHIIDHSLHPLHRLKLTRRSSNDNVICCYYCDKPFQNDGEYVYACDQLCSDFYMHKTCAMIPLPAITTSNVDGCNDHGVVHFACHQRPMALVDQQHHSEKRGATCFGCQSNWSVPAYSCISEECENFLHKSCVQLPHKIQNPFHSPHSLTLQVSKPRSCRSCCKKDCRLIFSCHEDGCDFVLCTRCASLDITPVKCRSHDHLLFLVDKSLCKIQCCACQNSYENGVVPNEINYTRSYMFRCMECVFNYHFLCGPLPSTIKYEFHVHPLILSDYSILKDDSDQYCCDVCEEERDQFFRIYYCNKCKFAAHIHCLIFEIMEVIKGDAKDVELKVVGENRWDLVDSLDRDQSKENSTQLTFKEIMDMLTQPEKEMLMDPFAFNNPSTKTFRRIKYDEYRQINSGFVRQGSIGDIHRIRQFFRLRDWKGYSLRKDDDFMNFEGEFFYFTPEEGFLKYLDERYLRQKVEDVNGYMVPRTLVPILKTLIRKYGRDLCGKAIESLTPAMKSITSTSICIVIDKMCKTKVEHITWDDLKDWYFCMSGIEEITGFQLPGYWVSFDSIVRAFLGLEAERLEKDLREKLETKMKKYKEYLENLKEDTSFKSDFMKNCSSRASEWKQKTLGDEWF